VPGLNADLAKQIEDDVKNKYGGRRFYIPKGAKHPTPEQRAALYKDGLSSMATANILKKHQVSRATLYRLMKGGGGRFS
jgi:Mor family transcriptional regulator